MTLYSVLMVQLYIVCAYATGFGTLIPASYSILLCNLDFTSKTYCMVLVKPVKAQQKKYMKLDNDSLVS